MTVRGVPGGGSAVGFTGLCTCGSVWSCPVCNAKIMSRRALELSAAITTWHARGGRVGFFTLTLRHRQDQPLDLLWSTLSKAWEGVSRTRVWRKWRDRLGSPGYVRTVEVTHGPNGWHVHIHGLLLLGGEATAAEVGEFSDWLVAKWCRSVARLGLDAPTAKGQDFRLIESASDPLIADYITKATDQLGLELTHSQGKIARRAHSTVTPWALLSEVIDQGDADALDLWHEWEHSSSGRRQINWSRGLRDLLGLGQERTDEEVAAETLGDTDLVIIPGEVWDADILRRPHVIPQILDAAEKGSAALRRFLIREQIEHRTVDL